MEEDNAQENELQQIAREVRGAVIKGFRGAHPG
jgi:hypothetical protein